MDEWIEQYSTPDDRRQAAPHARSAGKKAAAEEGRKTRAPRSHGPEASRPDRDPKPAAEVAPDRSAIGSNPERRFASASSRNLARKP